MASIASPVSPPSAPVDWMSRARTPLAAVAVILVAIDCIGLGLHLADETRDSITRQQPEARAQTRVTAPNAVVESDSLEASGSASRTRVTTPSGVLVGPVAPPVVNTPPAAPGTNPSTPTPPTPAVPLAQAGVAVPALGVQASLGLGDNSCTTLDLTLLALGDCPAPQGEGAVILQLGGSLLGN
ncbi:MAG: hypothetical protein Q8K63_01770 [Acidimicrobiales bacterium]|nr:hypothetical protein [Acidimicrobiales bacterium]